MTHAQKPEFSDMGEILYALEEAIGAVDAYNVLIGMAFESGDSYQTVAAGICSLLRTQVGILERAEDALRKEVKRIEARKLEIKDVNLVAQWSGVSPIQAQRVISFATGADVPMPETGKTLVENRTVLQDAFDRFIYYSAVNPVKMNDAAKMLNISPENVEDVLWFMLFGEVKQRPVETVQDGDRAQAEIPQNDEPAKASKGSKVAVRNQFIVEKAKEGMDASAIAQAMNMKRSTVEKVIGQMLAGKDVSAPPSVAKSA